MEVQQLRIIIKQLEEITRTLKKEILFTNGTKKVKPLVKPENWAWNLINWFSRTYNIKFPTRVKQLKALKLMKNAGYTPAQIQDAMIKMKNDTYWMSKSIDFMTLANHIHQYHQKETIKNDKYNQFKSWNR